MDFSKRREMEAVLNLLVSVAKLTIWGSENGIKMASACDVKKLRRMIQTVRQRIESMTLRLWYPLPHLVPKN